MRPSGFGFSGIYDKDEAERVIEGTTAEIQIGYEFDGPCLELISKGEDAARTGAEYFKNFWLGLGNDERQIKKRLYELSLTSESAVEVEMTQEGE